MLLIRFGLLACLIAAPAAAQSPMSADEFEAFVTGKTLDFSNSTGVFGTEEYLPGRRVRWAFTDDICKFGYWYEADAMICFAYDGYPDQHCWTVWVDGDHLAARPAEDSPDTAPRSITEATKPLTCLGPDVGV
jgi:hypothetical protein